MKSGLRRHLAVVSLATLLSCLACAPGREGEHDELAGDERGADEHEAATAWVEVAPPSDASLLELPAHVVASAQSRARVDTPLRGTVVGVSARVGDRVEVGDPIVELRIPAVLEAAAILAGTSKQIGSHKARRERLQELRDAGLVGAGEVFDVESGLGRLSAERRLALATLAAVGIDASERGEVLARGTVFFEAPIAGVVARVNAVPGDVVEPGEGLAQILGRAPARIEVAYGGELSLLEHEHPAAEAEGEPESSANAGAEPGASGAENPVRRLGEWASLEFEGLDGSHLKLAPSPVATAVEPGLGRVLAWYEPADPTTLLPDGVRGRVLIRSHDPDLLEVPRRALRLDAGRAWVGRRPEGGGPPQMVEVEVLRSVGNSALIRSEALAPGDRVAADAATVLQLGRAPGELGEGGHHH